MNKLVAFGVAVALCMAAAGFGAYLALRPQPAAVPVAAIGEAGVPAAQAAANAAAVSNPAATPAPVSTPAEAAPAPQLPKAAQTARLSKPAPAAAPAGGSRIRCAGPGTTGLRERRWRRNHRRGRSACGGRRSAAGDGAGCASPPPQKIIEELVVPADSVIGLRIESTVSSEVARIEDPVEARVTRDVRVGSEVVIASGSRVLGSVIQVERGGKMKTAARIGVRFHTLVLADNTRMPIHTEAIYREGKSPGNESAAKVGGAAVGGAILGAILGGGKGAAIGGAVGAAGGTGAVMAGGRNPAMLASGTSLTVRLSQPVTVVVERDELK